MKKQITVRVIQAHPYGGRRRQVGETYSVDPQLAIALRLQRLAVEVSDPGAEPATAKPKNTYKRRDMQAEKAS